MISLVEITDPPLGRGYQISEYSTYVTDETGSIVEPKEYYIVESPATTPPAWYTPQPVLPPEPLPPQVPYSVTMRQARLALLDSGLLSVVESALEALQEPQRTRSLIEWNHGSVVERNSGLVTQMSSSLGLTSQQVDNLFLLANTY